MIYKQIAVRLPRLLDADLNEVCRLRASTQSINLSITPLSTASLTLPDKSGVKVRSFVQLYNAKGSVGVYRVNMPEEGFGSGERISLEHGICVLDDAIVPGRDKITGTPRDVLEQILAHQTTMARGQYMWTLGDVEADEAEITVEHDGTKTLEMLSRVMGEIENCMLTFDQSEFPWVVNVVKKKNEASCEGRLSRNIRTIRKTVDDSDLCTRLYCSLLDGGYMESDIADAWGTVEQGISLNDDMPKEEAEAYCRRYLDNRKNPKVAIEMDADEWYAMTGERLDRFEIGDICRLALPEYGVTIEERIVALSYMDALGRPESVTVSIANQVQDMSIKTAEMEKEISDVKGQAAEYAKVTNTTIAHLKEEDSNIKEVNNKMVKWFSSAQINLDADASGANVGILATYEETHGFFEEVSTRVTQAELILHGSPDGATAGLMARVDDNEAAIILQANELGTLAEIKADKVDLGQYATVERLEAELAEFELSLGDSLVLRTLNVTGAASADSLYVANRANVGSFALGGTNLSLITKSVLNGNTTLTVNSTGGTVTGVTLNRRYTEFTFLGVE